MFGKWFASAYTGSMMGAGACVFAVWGWVVANAGPDGTLEINPALLAVMIGEDEADVRDALEFLMAPDPASRSEAEDGRRLLHLGAFAYQIVNHDKYRKMESEASRREYMRNYMRDRRAKASPDASSVQNSQHVNTRKHELAMLGEAEADTDAEAEAKEQRRARAPKSPASRSTRRKSKPPPANALAIAQYLYDAIMEHSPEAFAGAEGPAMARKMEGWARALDLAMRKDGATESQLRQVIDYAHRGPKTFWRPNIMSGKKLREQRTRLLVEMKAQGPPRQQRGQPTGVTEEAIDAASALLGVTWSDQ